MAYCNNYTFIEEGTKQDFKRCVLAALGSYCCGVCFDPLEFDECGDVSETRWLVCSRCFSSKVYYMDFVYR